MTEEQRRAQPREITLLMAEDLGLIPRLKFTEIPTIAYIGQAVNNLFGGNMDLTAEAGERDARRRQTQIDRYCSNKELQLCTFPRGEIEDAIKRREAR